LDFTFATLNYRKELSLRSIRLRIGEEAVEETKASVCGLISQKDKNIDSKGKLNVCTREIAFLP
jgi:hypothetical protein